MEHPISETQFLVSDLRSGEYVFVKPGGSDFGEVSGVVTRLVPPAAVEIHLHLEDEHPAMQDFIADFEDEDENLRYENGITRDQAEFYDVVALSAVERSNGTPIRVWTRAITAKERAERARRRGYERPSIPELDHGLRR